MTGVADENWLIEHNRFENTYLLLDSQMKMGESGLYLKKPMLVDAERVSAQVSIRLPNCGAELYAKAGDWILASPDDHVWVVADEIFSERLGRAHGRPAAPICCRWTRHDFDRNVMTIEIT